jgi:branched-chain amino acid transport system permease protein
MTQGTSSSESTVAHLPRKERRVRGLPQAAAIAVLLLLPVVLPSYLQSVAITALVYAIFAMSLDLILGYGGMISLGHAAFLGIGGYSAGVLMAHASVDSAWVGIIAAMLVAGLGAALAGLVALRVKGVYFMLVTFALAQLAFTIAQEWKFLTTGGAEGISGIRYPTLGIFDFTWSRASFYYFVLAFVVISYALLRIYVRSRLGVVLDAARQNESRARALGFNVWAYRYAAFIFSGAIAGLAGALFAYQAGIIVPANLGVLVSGTAVFMVLIGGAHTIYGAAIGALILTVIQYYGALLLPATWPLVLGVFFVAIVMFAEGGIVGAARRIGGLRRARPANG